MRFIILILLFIPFISIAQNRTIQAKLIDFSEKKIPAYCGYQIARTILKFKLIEKTKYSKKGDTILVLITCPREKGIKNYVNEKSYFLALGNRVNKKDFTKYKLSVFNKYENENLLMFWFRGFKSINTQ